MDIFQLKSISENAKEALKKADEVDVACYANIKKCQDLLDQWNQESSDFELLGFTLTKYFETLADTENLILPHELTVLEEEEKYENIEDEEKKQAVKKVGISFCAQTSFSPSVYSKTPTSSNQSSLFETPCSAPTPFSNKTLERSCPSDFLVTTPVSCAQTDFVDSPSNMSERRVNFAHKRSLKRKNDGLFKLTESILREAKMHGMETAPNSLDIEKSVEYNATPMKKSYQLSDSSLLPDSSVTGTIVETSSIISSIERSRTFSKTPKMNSNKPSIVPYEATVIKEQSTPTIHMSSDSDETKTLLIDDEHHLTDNEQMKIAITEESSHGLVPYDKTVGLEETTPELVSSRNNILSSDKTPKVKQALVDYEETVSGTPTTKKALVDYEETMRGTPATKKALVDYEETMRCTPAIKQPLVDYEETMIDSETKSRLATYPDTMIDSPVVDTQRGLVDYEVTLSLPVMDDTFSPIGTSKVVSYDETGVSFDINGETPSLTEKNKSIIETTMPVNLYNQTLSVIEKNQVSIDQTPFMEKSKSDTMSSWKRSLASSIDEQSAFENPNDTCMNLGRVKQAYEKHLDDELDYFNPNQTGNIRYPLRNRGTKLQKHVTVVNKSLQDEPLATHIEEENDKEEIEIDKNSPFTEIDGDIGISETVSTSTSEKIDFQVKTTDDRNIPEIIQVDDIVVNMSQADNDVQVLQNRSIVADIPLDNVSIEEIASVDGQVNITFVEPETEIVDLPEPAKRTTVVKKERPKQKRKKKRVLLCMPKDSRKRKQCTADSKYNFQTYSKVRAYKDSPANMKLRKIQCLSQATIINSARKTIRQKRKKNIANQTPLNTTKTRNQSGAFRSLTTSGSDVAKKLQMTLDDQVEPPEVAECSACTAEVNVSGTPAGTPIQEILCNHCLCALGKRNASIARGHITINTTTLSPHRGLRKKVKSRGTSKLLIDSTLGIQTERKHKDQPIETTDEYFGGSSDIVQQSKKSKTNIESPAKELSTRRSLRQRKAVDYTQTSRLRRKNNSSENKATQIQEVTEKEDARKPSRAKKKSKEQSPIVKAKQRKECHTIVQAVSSPKGTNSRKQTGFPGSKPKAKTTKAARTKSGSGMTKINGQKDDNDKKHLSIVNEEESSSKLEKSRTVIDNNANKNNNSGGQRSRKRKPSPEIISSPKKNVRKTQSNDTGSTINRQLRKRKNKEIPKSTGSPVKQTRQQVEEQKETTTTSTAEIQRSSSDSDNEVILNLPDGYQHWSLKKEKKQAAVVASKEKKDSVKVIKFEDKAYISTDVSCDDEANNTVIPNNKQAQNIVTPRNAILRKSSLRSRVSQGTVQIIEEEAPPLGDIQRPRPFSGKKKSSMPPPPHPPKGFVNDLNSSRSSRGSVQSRKSEGVVNESKMPGESTMSYLIRKKKKLFKQKGNRIKTPDSKEKLIMNSTAVGNRESLASFSDVDISHIQGRPVDLTAMNSQITTSSRLLGMTQGLPPSLSVLLNKIGKAKK